jgi:hypothetical protein
LNGLLEAPNHDRHARPLPRRRALADPAAHRPHLLGRGRRTATPVRGIQGTSDARPRKRRPYLHNRKDNDHADYLTTYVELNGPQAMPTIHLGVDGMEGVSLTPAEARRLARDLRKMARLARVP